MNRLFVIAAVCFCATFIGQIKANTLPSPYSSVWQSGALNEAHSGAGLPFPQCNGTDDLTISGSQSLLAGLYAYDELTVPNNSSLSFGGNAAVFIHVNKLTVKGNVNHHSDINTINPLVIVANEVDIKGSNIDALIYVRSPRSGLQSGEFDIQGSNIFGAVTSSKSLTRQDNVVHNYRFSSTQIGRTISQSCPNDNSMTATYLDKFDLVSYENSDGQKAWSKATPWVEAGENDGAGKGNVAIENGRLKLSGPRKIITRKLNLSAYNSATVSFDYEIDAQIDNEKVTFDVGTRNNRWKRITRFDRRVASGTYTYAIDPKYIHSNSRFRLRTNRAFDFGNRVDRRDFFYVDNFAVNATSISATYLDLFTDANYDNSHGEKSWSSSWQESERGNSPTRGHTRIRNGKLEIINRARSVERKFDLSTFATAELEFVLDYQTSSEQSDLTISLSKDNGVTWQGVYQFDGEKNGSGQRKETIGINPFAGEREVLLRINTSDQFIKNDKVEFDYIAVRGFGNRSPVDHYRIIHPVQGLACQNHPIELQACGNSDCSIKTTNAYTATVTKQVGGTSQTILNIDTAANPNSVRGTFNNYQVEDIRFALSNPSIAPVNGIKCFAGGKEQASCKMTLVASGFAVSAPNFVSASGWHKVSVEALEISKNNPTTCVRAYDNIQPVVIGFNHISAIRPDGNISLDMSLKNDGSDARKLSSSNDLNINLDFGTSNAKAEFYVSYPDAGELQLSVRDGGSVSGLSQGASNFVVTPAKLQLAAFDAGNRKLGDTGNLTHMAGEPFNLSIIAKNANDEAVKNYFPGHLQLQPSIIAPNFEQGSNSFSLTYAKAARIQVKNKGENLSWHNVERSMVNSFTGAGYAYPAAIFSEVGTFSLNVRDANYYNQIVGNGTSGNAAIGLGRMIPAYFSIEESQKGKITGYGNNYSYYGFKMPYETDANPKLTFIAKSLSGTTTQNYTGEQFKPESKVFQTRRYNAYTDNSFSNDKLLDRCFEGNNQTKFYCGLSTASVQVTGNTDHDGIFEVEFSGETFTYLKLPSVTEPVSANIQLELLATELKDSDRIGYCSGVTLDDDVTKCVGPAGNYEKFVMPFETNFEVRYGRLQLENSTGVETEAQQVPAQVEFWKNGAWQLNTDDSDTAFSSLTGTVTYSDAKKSPSNFALSIVTNADNVNQTLFNRGSIPPKYGFFVQPHNAERAQLEMSLNNVPSWLEIDWNLDGVIDHNDNVTSNVIFGPFSGNKRIIYQRER